MTRQRRLSLWTLVTLFLLAGAPPATASATFVVVRPLGLRSAVVVRPAFGSFPSGFLRVGRSGFFHGYVGRFGHPGAFVRRDIRRFIPRVDPARLARPAADEADSGPSLRELARARLAERRASVDPWRALRQGAHGLARERFAEQARQDAVDPVPRVGLAMAALHGGGHERALLALGQARRLSPDGFHALPIDPAVRRHAARLAAACVRQNADPRLVRSLLELAGMMDASPVSPGPFTPDDALVKPDTPRPPAASTARSLSI